MSKSILQQLFDGEIYPAEDVVLKEPQDKELSEKINNETKYFQSVLSPDDWKRYEDLVDMQAAASNAYHYAYFIYGFRLATKLIIEGLSSEEICSDTT